jgi:xanthine dehydrogenase/oxidase
VSPSTSTNRANLWGKIFQNVKIFRVNVHVKRLGGGFGGKQSRSAMISSACAFAAKKQNRPVRLVLPFNTNMEATSKRFGQRNEYEVGSFLYFSFAPIIILAPLMWQVNWDSEETEFL